MDGVGTITLTSLESGQQVACVESGVTNGKSFDVPGVSYVSAGIAGSALILTGFSALSSAGTVGAAASSVGFVTVMGWFQSMAINGALSVNYPPLYRSFAKNFAFATGLIPWNQMQLSIDHFRSLTGGNLTKDSVQYLQNATLVYGDGSTNSTTFAKRGLDLFNVLTRDVTASLNGTAVGNGAVATANSTVAATNQTVLTVSGMEAFAEQLLIPSSNIFMYVSASSTVYDT